MTHLLSPGQVRAPPPDQLPDPIHPPALTRYSPKPSLGLLPQGRGCRLELNLLVLPCPLAGHYPGNCPNLQPLQTLQLSGMRLFKLNPSRHSMASMACCLLSTCQQPLRLGQMHKCPQGTSPCSNQHPLLVPKCFIMWSL